jgi:predicted nucleotidyltransferase
VKDYTLPKTTTEEMFRFYLESSTHFRFPYYDPENPHRKNGLFSHLEETLMEAGENFQKEYGDNFISINLRGSWLRGIPLEDDDIDLLFIVRNLPEEEQPHILEHCRTVLRKKLELFKVCEGKMEGGVKVEPINFFNLEDAGFILKSFMYGLSHFLEYAAGGSRDNFQDIFFGSKMREKLLNFLKSGILIPYVGWIYGKWKKNAVFEELAKYLPVPTQKTGIYSEQEISTTKEILRKAFIARNLIYPSTKIEHFVDLSKSDVAVYMEEALELYRCLKPLESIHARAVLNYIYTAEIELKFFGKRLIVDRIGKFTGNYNDLVYYILHVKY